MEDDVKSLGDYIAIAWRRKFYILIPFLVVLGLAIAVVSSLPPVYQSTGTILIESQQIPEQLIQSTVTSFAGERIQVIKQRIMTREQLSSIIKKFNVFEDDEITTVSTAMLQSMRNRITIELVSANVRRRRATIAFTVAFEHGDAAITQKVVNELITLFLDENIRTRTARAEETSEFFKNESDRLRTQIEEMEARIASFKEENEGSLPENLRLNLERVATLKSSLLNLEDNLNELNERKKLLLIDVGAIEFEVAKSVGLSEEQLAQKQELQNLQNQFISLSARYGSAHPDVKTMQRQITAFEKEYGDLSDIDELQTQQQEVEQEILELSKNYSSEHPDVKRLGRKLEGIVAMIVKSEQNHEEATAVGSNPELLQAKARLESVENSIKTTKKTRLDLERQIRELDSLVNRTPQAERGLDALQRDYESTKQKYQEMKNKQLQAELSKSLEEEQKGERFTLLEPPVYPDSPIKPNRPKLFLLGLVLSMISGIGVAGVAETLDSGIRGARALAMVTKMTPLVTIPNIETLNDIAVKKRNIKIFVASAIIIGILFFVMVHLFYKPLDLLWFILLNRFNMT